MRNTAFLRAALAAACVVIACGGDVPTGSNNSSTNTDVVTAVVISPTSLGTLGVGASTTLTAVARNTLGQAISSAVITWSSSNTAVASVAGGVVTGVSAGTAQITASAGIVSATLSVTVAPPGAVKTVNVSFVSGAVTVGGTTQATVAALDANGTTVPGQSFTWASGNTAVATVSSNGLVTGVSAGTTTISATVGSITGNATVTVTTAAQPGPETPATLPQATVDVTLPAAPAAGGQVLTVSNGSQLQAALNSANYGDVIALTNGASFIGNFTLPAKGANNGKWITIRPANMAGFPAPGSRMTPTLAAQLQLPLIQGTTTTGTIVAPINSHHYRLIGLEVTLGTNVTSNTGLIRFGGDASDGQTTLASAPTDLILDRSYVHGSATKTLRRGVNLNSANSAVVDSYFSEIHESGADAQAILGWNGPGPFLIQNNYLEASGENIMFGGVDPSTPNLTPSDITIRHNHFYKPIAWKTAAGAWTVKNLFELKHAQRVLVEGNLMENIWAAAQAGTAVSMKTVNQNGTCTWCVTQDVTFRYNLLRNVGGGFTISASPDNTFQDIHARRITIVDNIVHSINQLPFDGIGQGLLVNGDVADLIFAHNTVIDPPNFALDFGGGSNNPAVRLSFRDNAIGGGTYGVKASGFSAGSASFNALVSGGTFTANALVLPTGAAGYPVGNTYFLNVAAVGFVSPATFDFHLASSSSLRSKASDGRDVGANVDAVLSATSGVIVP